MTATQQILLVDNDDALFSFPRSCVGMHTELAVGSHAGAWEPENTHSPLHIHAAQGES